LVPSRSAFPTPSEPAGFQSPFRPPALPVPPPIQLGVEAIRQGRTDRSLVVATDGSVSAEALIRFSLLSALSTQNDPPEKASKPFSKDRDGFVIAEGAATLVLESLESAISRGAKVLGILKGCGEKADHFHRTRSSPDGGPAIATIRAALEDAGMTKAASAISMPTAHRRQKTTRWSMAPCSPCSLIV
jgi:3-oxoacyl-(acyl-carrier-protein) synthase